MASLFSRNARMTRTKFALFLIGGNVALAALGYSVSTRLAWSGPFTIPRSFDTLPWWLLGLHILYTLLLILFAVARLHDIGRPGWWLLVFPALTIVASIPILPGPLGIALAVAALAAWLALILYPGTIGPNRFGADPRGWESREQFDAQKQRLEEEVRSHRVG
jgi:uncharacterized membrane protein YhaH (DUF805 family)